MKYTGLPHFISETPLKYMYVFITVYNIHRLTPLPLRYMYNCTCITVYKIHKVFVSKLIIV